MVCWPKRSALLTIAAIVTFVNVIYFANWSEWSPRNADDQPDTHNNDIESSLPNVRGQTGGEGMLAQSSQQAQQDVAFLNNGVLMPWLGFGTAGLGGETLKAVQAALGVGFRHIDTAQAREWYREDLVGAALRASAIRREELFLTTKIHPRHLGPTVTLDVFANSLGDLGTTYLDLVLLHYPACWGSLCNTKPEGSWQDAWRALEDLQEAGRIKAIGVSNFNMAELHQLLEGETARKKPQVLQIRIDPLAQNKELVSFCQARGVQVEAYSSLGTQWGAAGPSHRNPVLTHPVLEGIAQEVNRTVAQVILRWLRQLHIIAIPRSSNPDHMREALHGSQGFELSPRHMDQISKLDGTRPR